MARLIIEEGFHKGREYRFSSEATIGRGKDNLVTIEDPRVSVRHAKIAAVEGKHVIQDLDSRNGIYHNGERVRTATLAIGDKVKIGGCVLSLAEDPKGKWAGRVIAGYEILDLAGQGGMGIVYKARQISLDRIVALKLMHEHLMKDPKFVERFLSEAKAAAGLNHSGIVQVHDVGCEEGVYFFSMEYIDGVTLAERLSKGPPLPPLESARIVAQVADALDHAHAKGIVHRDVKPDNILIGQDGNAKLGDLGVAKQSREVDTHEQGRRVLVGTPAYIAPEEVLGRGGTPQSDLYSLGATLYHLLAGRAPYISASVTETIRMHLHNTPPDIRKYNPSVPRELCEIVSRMMAKDPRARPRSAREAADLLRAPLSAATAQAGPSRRPLWAAAAGLGVLTAAAGGYLLLRPGAPPPAGDAPSSAGQGRLSSKDLYYKGTDAYAAKRYDEAERLLHAAIEQEKVDPSSQWSALAQNALALLEKERRDLRHRKLDEEFAEITRMPGARIEELQEKFDRLVGLRTRCAEFSALSQAVGEAHRDTARRLEEMQEERARIERQSKERLTEFQLQAARIESCVTDRRFGEAWRLLDGLQKDLLGREEKDLKPIVEKSRALLERRMNAYFDQEKASWETHLSSRRHAAAWRRLLDAEKALADTPFSARIGLERRKVAEALAASFGERAASCRASLKQFDESSLKNAVDGLWAVASEFEGTEVAPACEQELALARTLQKLHRTLVAEIQRADPARPPVVVVSDATQKRLRVVGATGAQVTFEMPAAGGVRIRENAPWTEIPPRKIYEISLGYLDERRRETQEWLLAFCSTYDLPQEAAVHKERLK